MLRYALLGLAGVCVVLGLTLCVRAALVSGAEVEAKALNLPKLDANAAATRLARILAIPSVTGSDAEVFLELQRRLEENYPKAFVQLEKRGFGPSLMLRWRGKSETAPPLLMVAHQDVVPVQSEKDWIHGPFSGDVADGFIWGRGALDDKASLAAMLEAVELLVQAGERPSQTVYFAFGHDEEAGGMAGAREMANYFERTAVKFSAVLDEGPLIESDTIPGLDRPLAKIGLAEKGYVNVELTAEGEGGHSSMPPERTTVGLLAKAIARIEDHPMDARLSEPVLAQLQALAPVMPFGSRLAFANLWLFEPMLVSRMTRASAQNALVRTTLAPTMFEGSNRENVLAKRARAIVNVRLLPGDHVETAVDHMRAVIDDPRVNLAIAQTVYSQASKTSRTDSRGYRRLQAATKAIYPDAAIAPSLVVIATDSRHYAAVAEDVYRFLPVPAKAEDLSRLHGSNERIAVDAYGALVRFYAQYLGMPEVD